MNRTSRRVGVARHQHQHRVRLIDARQVEEVAVLPVLVVDVARVDAGGGAPENGERVGAQPFHDPRPAGLKVVLKGTGRGRRAG